MEEYRPSSDPREYELVATEAKPNPSNPREFKQTYSCYDDIVPNSNSQHISTPKGVKVAAKKLAHGCPCSWVCIGLVLVGVVACVSMAVAVWSIAKVHNISNSCEANGELVGQINSDRIEELNATLISVMNGYFHQSMSLLLHVCKSLSILQGTTG